jgi:two-component system phosphate regulon sensor histidine kinase PhoR
MPPFYNETVPTGPATPSRKWLKRITVLKLLPAALVGLIPLSSLDESILGLQYSIRGPRPAPRRLLVIQAPPAVHVLSVSEIVLSRQPRSCILLSLSAQDSTFCQEIDLSGIYSFSSLMDLRHALKEILSPESKLDSANFEPVYYGELPQFETLRYSALMESSARIPDADTIIFVPSAPLPPLSFKTAAGPLNTQEVVLNLAGNLLEGRSLRRIPLWGQFILTAATAALSAWFLYSFPTALTALFLVALSLFWFVGSMVFFDRMAIQLPTAAPLISLLAVYVLGLSDRLDRREKMEWALRQEAESLRALEEMRNNFLSLVSHDLKTPIARMQALIDRLLGGDAGALSPEQTQILRRAMDANGHLQRSISTLLLLSRIESRDLRLRRAPTDLTELLADCARQMQPHASERNIRIETQFEPLFLVDMDASLIREVASNLLENAIKYTPVDGVVEMRCGETENCLDLMPPQPAVWFEIQDHGPGIPPADRPRVVEKFFRSAQENIPSDQSVKGTGLGLYLSSFFVEKHGGRLTLHSRTENEREDPATDYFGPGESGTVARVALPLESLYDELAPPPA